MAPNFDNNIALISRGYLQNKDRGNDGLIRFFREFLAENTIALQMYRKMELPVGSSIQTEDKAKRHRNKTGDR